VLDASLAKQGTDYLVGDKVTYADIMFISYSWVLSFQIAPEVDFSSLKHYTAWCERLFARPAIRKVFKDWVKEMGHPKYAAGMEKIHGKDWKKKLGLDKYE
jgi:glutathione S-transferase